MILRNARSKTAQFLAKATFVVLASSTAFAEDPSTQLAGETSIGMEIQRRIDLLAETIDPTIPEKLHATTGQNFASQTELTISTPLPGEHFHYSAHWTYLFKLKKEATFNFEGKDIRCDDPVLPDGHRLTLQNALFDEIRGPKCSCEPTPEAYCKYVENAVKANIKDTFIHTYTRVKKTFPFVETVTVDVSSCYDQGVFSCDIFDKVPQPGGCGGPTTPPVVTTTTATTTTMPKTTTAVAP